MATWDEVVAAPEFNALPIEQKASVRNAFFDREIAPKAPAEAVDQVREAFLKRTDESLRRTGVAAGAVSAKPEAIQDSAPFWKEQAIKGVAQIPEFSGTVADVALSPIDKIINIARAAMGKPIEKAVSIADDFRGALRRGGIVKDIPPTTEAQRVFGKPVEFVAGSLPFSVGNVAGATGRRAITAGTEILSNVGGGLGAAEGEMAGRQIGGEGGATAGSLAGGLVGGGVSAMAVPQAISKAAGAGKTGLERLFQMGTGGRKLTEEQLNEILGPKLAQILRADPSAAANLAESGNVAAKIPGFTPDLASATGSKVIGAMKERVSREGENVLARFVRLSETNQKRLEEFRGAMFPKGGERPQDIARRKVATDAGDLEKYSQGIEQSLKKQLAETETGIENLTRVHEKSPDNTAIGERLTELREQAAKLKFAQAQAQYIPVYELADRMGWRADVGPMVEFVRKAMRDGGLDIKSDQTPSVFRDILRFADRKRLEDTRDAIEQAARKAGGKLPTSISQYVARYGGMSRAEVGGNLDSIVDAKNPRDYGKLPLGLSEGESRRLVSGGGTAKSPSNVLLELKAKGYLTEDADLNDMYEAIRYEVQQGRPTTFAAVDQNKAYEQQMLAAQERFTQEKGSKAAAAKAAAGIEIPFREFHDLQRRINRDLQRPGRATENLMQLKDQVRARLAGEENSDLAGELQKANDFWLREWKTPFLKGAGGMIARESKAAEDVVQKAFLSRGERGADDWRRIYGDNPEAARLLYEGAADSFVSAAVKGGQLNLSSAKNWLNSNDRFLKAFPDLRKEFDTVIRGVEETTVEGAAKAGVLQDKLKSIEQAKKELEQGALAKIAGVEDTATLASRAISSPKEMDSVLRLVRQNPQAKQGFATELANSVINRSNPEAFMLSHADSLEKAFDDLGPGHWDNLQAIVKGEQIMARGGDPKKLSNVELGGDPMQEMLGTGSSQLFSMAKGLGSWVSPEYAVFHIGGRYLFKVRRDQEREFLVELLTNPDVAKRLADTYKDVTPARAEEIAKGLYTQGSREAMDQLRQMRDEVAPLMRLHGIRVTVNAANVPGREESRKEQESKAETGTKGAVQAQGQKRLRDLQGIGAGR